MKEIELVLKAPIATAVGAPLEIVHVCSPVPPTFPDESVYTAPARLRLASLVENAAAMSAAEPLTVTFQSSELRTVKPADRAQATTCPR